MGKQTTQTSIHAGIFVERGGNVKRKQRLKHRHSENFFGFGRLPAYIKKNCIAYKATLYPKFWWIVFKELKEVFELEEF